MSARCINTGIARHIATRSLLAGLTVAVAALAVMEGDTAVPAAALALMAAVVTGGLSFFAACRTSQGLVRSTAALADANVDVLEVLGGAVAKREAGPGSQNHRVVLYAVRLGRALDLTPAQIRSLIKGAFVHDVGNVVLPDSILLKRGGLDSVEFEAIKTHTFHGADIVAGSEWLRDAVDVVRHHHEKWDGTGYPAGLAGEAIPVTARVFAVVDVFDALTSERPYRKPLDLDKALDIMTMGGGGHFDPEILGVFLGIARRMHQDLAGRAPAALAAEMRAAVHEYFREPA